MTVTVTALVVVTSLVLVVVVVLVPVLSPSSSLSLLLTGVVAPGTISPTLLTMTATSKNLREKTRDKG